MNPTLELEVRKRAGHRCEYCLLPQAAFKRSFHIEHVVARQHRGRTVPENLALACWYCNLKKGPNLSGIDPETQRFVPLYNPRQQRWSDHFRAILPLTPGEDAASATPHVALVGRTAIGRATVSVLDMNDAFRGMLRFRLAAEGLYVAPTA